MDSFSPSPASSRRDFRASGTSLDEYIASFVARHGGASDSALAPALVHAAGILARAMRSGGLDTEYKTSVSDVVTAADRAAERFVATVLKRLRPADGVRGEEGTQRASESGRVWVIDPVDGTYNFTSGSDYWCSAVALVTGDPQDPDELHFGAVCRPELDTVWFGGPGRGTYRNGHPVPELAATAADRLCLGTYLHPPFFVQPEVRDPWLGVTQRFASLRMLGAGSVDLAGVASGQLGAWLQHSVPEWDWLPGRALVEGAGGHTQRLRVGAVTWSFAGNQRVIEEIARVLTAI